MFEYKIDGPALKDGIPIHIAASALDNFQSIVDKTFLVSIGAKRLSAKDRERFQLKASKFSQGSLTTVFDIMLSGVQLILPFAGSLGPQNIWDYTKDTFAFLKLVCSSVQNEERPTYQFNNNGNVVVNTGNTTNNFYAPVIQIGELALPSYQSLAHLIDPQTIDFISAGIKDSVNPDIFLGKDDKNIFDIPTRIEKDSINLDCEIFDFNKYKNIGKISIKDKNQAIPIGEYNFTISGAQNNIDYIYSMLKPSVKVICNIEMESNPFGGEDKVYKLHIIGISP
ncbi:MAG: fructose 1,6-bisphosphatase [Desulfobacteraceae bacterium]|jgi:hypothetical protein